MDIQQHLRVYCSTITEGIQETLKQLLSVSRKRRKRTSFFAAQAQIMYIHYPEGTPLCNPACITVCNIIATDIQDNCNTYYQGACKKYFNVTAYSDIQYPLYLAFPINADSRFLKKSCSAYFEKTDLCADIGNLHF